MRPISRPELTASLLALNCGDDCENHTFDIDTVLSIGSQHLWLCELDCKHLLCCYPFGGFRSLFDWQLGQMSVAWVGSEYAPGGQHQCAVRCEAFWAHQRVGSKMVVEAKKGSFSQVSGYLVSIRIQCVVPINTFNITSLNLPKLSEWQLKVMGYVKKKILFAEEKLLIHSIAQFNLEVAKKNQNSRTTKTGPASDPRLHSDHCFCHVFHFSEIPLEEKDNQSWI